MVTKTELQLDYTEKVVRELVKEIAMRDLQSLRDRIADMPFENAYKTLNGFNRLKGDDFFVFNYKTLNGTINRTEDGKCDFNKIFAIFLDDAFTEPIAYVEFDDEGKTESSDIIITFDIPMIGD